MGIRDELIEYMGGFITRHKRDLFDRIVQDRTTYIQAVLDAVDDPLDANAAFRSCECFGIQRVHWIQGESGAKMSRGVSVGATKWLDLSVSGPGTSLACATGLRRSGLRLFAMSTRAEAVPLDRLPLDRPLALMFTSETRGFTRDLDGEVDGFATLPMGGFGDHFNFSVAVALSLQHLTARIRKEGWPWQLDEGARTSLILDWYATVPKSRRQMVARFLESKGLAWEALAPPVTSPKFWDLMGRPGEI